SAPRWPAAWAGSRVDADGGQAGGLGQPEQQVGVLDRLAGRALAEVVLRRHDHDAVRAGVDGGGHVDAVGPVHRLGVGE
ncbi:hypothetical protein DF186_24320, partial [Enterococcus hirae]